MAGNFGKPFQHYSEQNIYLDLGNIRIAECLKYGVGEKLDYTKLSAEQLKAVPKVIVKKLTNPGQIDFQFNLRRMKKTDQKIAKNQFFDAVYEVYRLSMLNGIRLIKKLLNKNESLLQSRELNTEVWRIGLKEIDRQINKIHHKCMTGIETKESLILQLDVLDYAAKDIWCGVQLSVDCINSHAREITPIEPGEQPSTSRWASGQCI